LTGCLLNRLQRRDKGLELVFPRLDADARQMVDWISDPASRVARNAKAATLPVIPNQFLARVSDDIGKAEITSLIDSVFDWEWTDLQMPETNHRSEWRRLCDRCRVFLGQGEKELTRLVNRRPHGQYKPLLWQLWDVQLACFWQTTWLLWPAPGEAVDSATLRRLFAELPVGRLWDQAPPDAQPSEWMMRYQAASHRFEAHRRTRGFSAWAGRAGLHKDSLSGKEEALATKDWLAQIPRGAAGKDVALNHLFRKSDPLGAPNVVKRVWHKAYLEAPADDGGMGLNKRELENKSGSYFDIPSVPGVAAFPWGREIWVGPEDSAFQKFWPAVEKLDDYLDLELPNRREWTPETAKDWLARVDWEVFREEFWEDQLEQARESQESEWTKTANQGLQAVRQFLGDRRCGSPSSYYAVLAGDGDGTGRWLSGMDSNGELFNLGPGFHEAMSASLARFAASNARHIVEDIEKQGADQKHFQGKLIFAGGEDVLAILPADQAIACACALRQAYQALMPHQAKARFTYSAGIAIGHIKEPLQDMIEAARLAENRAKNELDRNALSVTLFKRSGETILWGAKFDSPAFELLDSFRPLYRTPIAQPGAAMPITGRFPHRVIQALAKFGPELTLTPALAEIALAELHWIIGRQTRKGLGVGTDEDLKKLQQGLEEQCKAYLEELVTRRRPLCEFYDLFAVEAFIARQGD